ncbi:MAG: lipoprotein [Clostridia bacterium]|jgi:major membrane immunogen (membrane-anchored lipoprotein)|nr:lipoprotein [Clostridia bacterium]
MKKLFVIMLCTLLIVGTVISCARAGTQPSPAPSPTPAASPTPVPSPTASPTPVPPAAGTAQGLKDGTYEAESTRSEKGWYKGKVTIKDGKFTVMEFTKYDSEGEKVDLTQYKYPQGVEAVQTYPKKFIEVQDASKVDKISGATTTYNAFQEIIGKIRQQAAK